MIDHNQCPTCQHKNESNRLVCERCDTPLLSAGATITFNSDTETISYSNPADTDTMVFDSNDAPTLIQPPSSFQTASNGQANTALRTDAADPMAKFKIMDVLGQGGMGAVYRAEDLHLQRFVALKLFSPGNASTSENQTLLEEARLACKLNHPNIVTIHDVPGADAGEQQNQFIVMEWVDGKSLDKLIPENGYPPVKALEYACQIADGLVCAHDHKIIHRDIKPHNLMVNQDDTLKILDFGIASLQHNQASAAGTKASVAEAEVTRMHGLVGTPQYMAPEQIQHHLVDERSDIFAFGVVLYEMLTGRRPFKGDTMAQLQNNIVVGTYPPVKDINPEVTPELIAILDKMLATDATQRWQTAQELSEEIHFLHRKLTAHKNWFQRQHKLTQAAIILPFVLTLGWSVQKVVFPPTTQELVQRQVAEASKIALLPFDNISGDPLLQIFVDGLSISLNSDLTTAGFEQGDGTTWVIPSGEIRKLDDVSAKSVFDKFGVELVISGSVQHFGSTRSVVLNLLNASDGRQIKTAEVSIDANKLFEGEHAVREKILKLLSWQVSEQTLANFNARQPKFDGAYKHYIEGQGYLYRFDQEGNLDKALAAFEQAIEIDEDYIDAYVGQAETQLRYYRNVVDSVWLEAMAVTIEQLADLNSSDAVLSYLRAELHVQKGQYQKAINNFNTSIASKFRHVESLSGLAKSFNRLNNIEKAEKAWRQARTLAPNNWRVLADLGVFYFQNSLFGDALLSFKSLSEMSPNNSYGYRNVAAIYYSMGDIDLAIEYTLKAIKISPNANAYSNLGTMYFYKSEYGKAVSAYEKAVELNPSNYVILGNLADSYKLTKNERATEMYFSAIESVERKLAINPNDTEAIAISSYYYANTSQVEKSLEMAKKITFENNAHDLYYVALAYDELNEVRQAINYLKYALEKNYPAEEVERSPLLVNSKSSEDFKLLTELKNNNY